MTPRPYQEKGIKAVLQKFTECNSTLVSWATGLGKTVLFAYVINRMLVRQGDRAMVMPHRRELLKQSAKTIKKVTNLPIEFERAEEYADREQHGLFKWKAPVIVTSVQTQIASHKGGHRMDRFDPNDFTLLVVDEAHHATAASWRAVIEHYRQNDNLKVLGVTATPNRHDEESLGQIFGSAADEMSLLDGIMEGWLVEVAADTVHVGGMDLSKINLSAGDLNGRELANVMEREGPLHQVVYPTIKVAGNRKTLVFAASVPHAELMSEIFNRHEPNCAAVVHGKTPDELRDRIIAKFRAGDLQYLCNYGIANEGFDVDDIGCIAMARKTLSQPLYQQMAGRGTRVLESLNIDQYGEAKDRIAAIAASSKPELLLIDFVGNHGRHKLMTAVDVLGGNCSEDVLAIARDGIQQSGRTQNVREILSEAEKKEREQSTLKRESDDVERQRRHRGFRPEVEFTMKEVNPFDVYGVSARREHGWNKGRLPSPKQVAAMERFGVKDADRYTFSAASQILDQLIGRMKEGRCTFKQSAILEKRGFSIDCSIDEASTTIDKIVRSGWTLYGPGKRKKSPGKARPFMPAL